MAEGKQTIPNRTWTVLLNQAGETDYEVHHNLGVNYAIRWAVEQLDEMVLIDLLKAGDSRLHISLAVRRDDIEPGAVLGFDAWPELDATAVIHLRRRYTDA